MNERRTEITVGIFVLLGAACLVWLSLVMGRVGGLGLGSYDVYAHFSSVEGLTKGASVEIAGVPVGRVSGISLKDNRARVVIRIRRDVKLDEEIICSVRTKGIIGEKYLRLDPGGSDDIIAPGGRIRETVPPMDLQALISQFIHGDLEAD